VKSPYHYCFLKEVKYLTKNNCTFCAFRFADSRSNCWQECKAVTNLQKFTESSEISRDSKQNTWHIYKRNITCIRFYQPFGKMKRRYKILSQEVKQQMPVTRWTYYNTKILQGKEEEREALFFSKSHYPETVGGVKRGKASHLRG